MNIAIGQLSRPRPADCISGRRNENRNALPRRAASVVQMAEGQRIQEFAKLRSQLLVPSVHIGSCIRSTLHRTSILMEALRLQDPVFASVGSNAKHLGALNGESPTSAQSEMRLRRLQFWERDSSESRVLAPLHMAWSIHGRIANARPGKYVLKTW
jgi:hypothetical protein